MVTRKAILTAVLASLLAAGSLQLYLRRHELALAGSAARSVVVATRDLARGELIQRSALDFRDLPERYVEERHIDAHDLERVVGTRASTGVLGGSALLWSDLDLTWERRSLSSLVRAGKRAFSLRERELSFDGLLCPGDRVDVLFTPAESGTHTLLQNVLVLTVGDDLGNYGEPAAAPVRRSGRVTLSVGLEQAELLAASEGRGRLRLALRNPDDLTWVELSAPASTDQGVQLPVHEPSRAHADALPAREGAP